MSAQVRASFRVLEDPLSVEPRHSNAHRAGSPTQRPSLSAAPSPRPGPVSRSVHNIEIINSSPVLREQPEVPGIGPLPQ